MGRYDDGEDRQAKKERQSTPSIPNASAPAPAVPMSDEAISDKGHIITTERQKEIDRDVVDAANVGALDKTAAVDTHAGQVKKINDKFVEGQTQLSTDAKVGSTESNRVYKDLNTRMTGTMADADLQAKSAMNLSDYMNPDNQVAKDTRALYERQAQGEQGRGYADYGVLASLGSSSAANAMAGAGPLSLGQQMAYIGQGQGQAGEAYARAQQRMQGLRDQGLAQGFVQSDKAYGAGQDAKKRQSDLIGQRENMNSNEQNINRGFRDEQGNFQGNIMGANTDTAGVKRDAGIYGANQKLGVSGLKHSLGTNIIAGDSAQQDKIMSIRTGKNVMQANTDATNRASTNNMWGNVLNAGATVAGGVLGGPIGGIIANRMTAPPPPAPTNLAGDPTQYTPNSPYKYQSSYGGRYNV